MVYGGIVSPAIATRPNADHSEALRRPGGGRPARGRVGDAGVDGQSISNAETLLAAVHSKAPAVNYLDASGGARTAQVLLGTDQGQQ